MVREIDFSSKLGGDDYFRGFAVSVHVTFQEDDSSARPFVFHDRCEKQKCQKKAAFAMIEDGRIVPGTFVKICDGEFKAAISMTQASEFLVSTITLLDGLCVPCLTIKYAIAMVDLSSMAGVLKTDIYEISVQMWDGRHTKSRDPICYRAILTGRKLVIAPSCRASAKLFPLMPQTSITGF